MDSFFLIVILLLLLVLACFSLLYFVTQQSLQQIFFQLAKLQMPEPRKREPNLVRQERAGWQDKLALLEAELHTSQRQALTGEELQSIDSARTAIKNCCDELKQTGEWIGLPFDLEWVETLDRLPAVKTLYRQSELASSTSLAIPGAQATQV